MNIPAHYSPQTKAFLELLLDLEAKGELEEHDAEFLEAERVKGEQEDTEDQDAGAYWADISASERHL